MLMLDALDVACQGADDQRADKGGDREGHEVVQPLSRPEASYCRSHQSNGCATRRGRDGSQQAHRQDDGYERSTQLSCARFDTEPLSKKRERERQGDDSERMPFRGMGDPGARDQCPR